MAEIRLKSIIRVLGALLVILGLCMFLSGGVAAIYRENDLTSHLISGAICLGTGALGFLLGGKKKDGVNKREGYLIVTLGWLVMAFFGALPYVFSSTVGSYTDAFFETMSGLTTTGASIMNDIESLPHGVLFWRSLTQWIGGMGIIVLTVAILPLLGIGGIELFVAESPGPTSSKIHPKIKDTARALWLVYVALTAAEAILLRLAGMNTFDAINHALTTMATGGFSTKNASAAAFSPLIQYIITLFMIFAGTNFTLLYFGFRGKLKKVWASEEFRIYGLLILAVTVITTIRVYMETNQGLESAFRDTIFQTVSIITTTGFVSADYTAWAPGITIVFFVLMLVGGSAGSTSGGIKIIRHVVFAKNTFLEFKRILHPRAIIRVKIDKEVVPEKIITHILVFLLVFVACFVVGVVAVVSFGMDFVSAAGAVATSLGNVGPGIGQVGPMDNFAPLSVPVKWILSVLMLVGRLELFTVLVLLTPYFWRTN